MNKLVLYALGAFAMLVGTGSSCERKPCPENTICTEVFSLVTIQVTDKNGQPVTLTEAFTEKPATEEIIRLAQNMQDGRYVVLDDSYRKNIENTADSFRFVGTLNGQPVVSEMFIIGADCCHIQKHQGKEEVQL